MLAISRMSTVTTSLMHEVAEICLQQRVYHRQEVSLQSDYKRVRQRDTNCLFADGLLGTLPTRMSIL